MTMSNVIYQREKPQEERQAEERQQKLDRLTAYLPTKYEGYKLTEIQRQVLEFIIQMKKSGDPFRQARMPDDPITSYPMSYLWVKFPSMSIRDYRDAGRIISELGEDSVEAKECRAWIDFIALLIDRHGALDPAITAELAALQTELDLHQRDMLVMWFEHMLAHC
jgi:hypothetical protein